MKEAKEVETEELEDLFAQMLSTTARVSLSFLYMAIPNPVPMRLRKSATDGFCWMSSAKLMAAEPSVGRAESSKVRIKSA